MESYGRSPAQEASLSPDLYLAGGYFSPHQWMSYRAQVDCICRLAPDSVLEVGLGNGIVSAVLRNLGYSVKTCDINPALHPDLVGSLLDLPELLRGETFQAVLCAEVLEHLPWDCFDQCLHNLARATTRWVVIPLPRARRNLLQAHGRLGRWNFDLNWRFPSARILPEHHWEIGASRKTSLRSVIRAMQPHFTIEAHCRLACHPSHYLFLLRKVGA
jgi:hypothetical protein